ncbi:hypothetical protein FQR65_LT06346 [Abscondita terminalis]|nr:hypothetical protein FQR65_LT06346 [Abscondita terminalis]
MSIPSTMEEQESGTVIKRLSVPIGLEELMSGLAKEVLHKQPQDIYTFASEHFARLLALRDESSYIQRFASAKFAHTTSEKATQDTKKNLCRQLSVCGAYSEKINNKLNTDNNKDGKRKDRRRRPLRNKTNLLPLKETDSNQNLQRDNKKPLSGDSKKGRKSRRSSSADEKAKSLLSESPTKVQKEVSPCEAADLVSKIEVPSIGKTSTENGAETKFVPDAESEETPKDEKTTKKSEEQDLDNDKNDESKKDDFEHQKELSTLEEMHNCNIVFGMNPSSSSKVNESDDKQDRLRASKSLGDVKDDKTILLARSLSVTDSVISKTLDDDEDKLHSIEDTESEDLGIDSEKLHTGLKEKTNSVLSDEECVPIMDENENTSKVVNLENLTHSSEMHDTLVMQEPILLSNNNTNEDLQHSGEMHDTLTVEHLELHDNLPPTNEIHEVLSSGDKQNVVETSDISGNNEHESKIKESDETDIKNQMSLAQSSNALDNSDAHDEILKENVQIFDSTSPSLNEDLKNDVEKHNLVAPIEIAHSSLISTSEMHDAVPVEDQTSNLTSNDHLNPEESSTMESSSRQDLSHSSEMHDTTVIFDTETKNSNSLAEQQLNPSSEHDTSIDEPITKSASPTLSEQLSDDKESNNTKERDEISTPVLHEDDVNPVKKEVNLEVQSDLENLKHSSETHDVILNEDEPKIKSTIVNEQLPHSDVHIEEKENDVLIHSGEMHDPIIVVKENVQPDDTQKDLLLTGEITDTIADKEVATSNECHESGDVIISKEIPHREEVHEAAVVKEEGLSHNSESGYTAIIEDEPKIDKITKSLNDQLPHSTEIINDDLSHSSELHDTVIVEKDASLQADGGLSHSSETHDTITSVDEPKIDKTEELLSEQSPHITKSPDLINADLIVAHGAIVDDEDVDSEGVTLKSDAGLSHSSENHDTVISEDESKIDKTERSLNEQSSYITQTCDVINAHLTQNSEAHDETSDKENVESESVTSKIGLGLDHSGETHDTVLSEIEPKINQIEESINEQSLTLLKLIILLLKHMIGTHGAIVDKEDVDSKAVTLKSDVGLSHSSESYDTVISNNKIEESLNEQSPRITKTPDLINADLSQTSGAHDAVVYKKDGDSESVNLNSDTGLSHSSETHDTVTSSDESKINKTEESLNKQSPHGVINDELTHSTETHVEVGKKEDVDSEGLTSKGDAGLNHSSETHDTITSANEPKIDETEESLSEQSPHIANTPDLINANLSAAHDAVVDKEDVDSESVTLNSDTGLSHSSETHDTITSTDEPKIDKTEESLNVQSPYDVIDDELAQSTEAHADVGKTENVKTEGVTSKSGAGLSNSEAHDTLTSADEPKIDKTEESLSEQSPHIANTPDLINGNLSQTSAAHDAVVDKEDVDSEGVTLNSDTGLSHSSETHDTVTSAYEPKINKTEESLNEQSPHDVINVELTQNTEAHVEVAKNENAEIEGVTSKGDADLSHSSETHDTIASADEPKTGAVHDAVVDKEDVDGEGVTLNSDTGLSHSSETHDTIASADEPKIDKIEESLSEQSPHIANTPDLMNADFSQNREAHNAVVDKYVDSKSVTLKDDAGLSHSSETHDTVTSADELEIDKTDASSHITKTHDVINDDLNQSIEALGEVGERVEIKSKQVRNSRVSACHILSEHESKIEKTEESLSEQSLPVTKTPDSINTDFSQTSGTHDAITDKEDVDSVTLKSDAVTEINDVDGADMAHSNEIHDAIDVEEKLQSDNYSSTVIHKEEPNIKVSNIILNQQTPQNSDNIDNGKEEPLPKNLDSLDSSYHSDAVPIEEPIVKSVSTTLNEQLPHNNQTHSGVSENEKSNLILHDDVSHSDNMHDTIKSKKESQIENNSTANTYHISDTSDTLDEEKPSNGTHSIDLDNPKELQTTNIILNKNQEDAVVQDDFNIKKTVSALNKIVPSEDNILEKDDTNDSNTSKNVLEEKDELPIQTQLKESLNQINETHLPVVTNEEPASTKSPKLPENLDQTDNPAIMEKQHL